MNRPGFTLIELLLVIAIIIFIARILLPNYMKHYQTARQTEVTVNLSNLYSDLQQYYMTHGTFTADLKKIGWAPKGYDSKTGKSSHYYTYGFYVSDAKVGTNYFLGTSGAEAEKLGSCHADGTSFVAKAVAKSSNSYDTWRLDESGTITHESVK